MLNLTKPVFSLYGITVSIVAGSGTLNFIFQVLPVNVSTATFLNSVLSVCLEPSESKISILAECVAALKLCENAVAVVPDGNVALSASIFLVNLVFSVIPPPGILAALIPVIDRFIL